MQLNGAQLKALHTALLAAFPNLLDLIRLTRFHLDQNLAELTTSENLSQTAFQLIEWTVAHDRLPDLLVGACRENPDNRALRRIAVQSGLLPDNAPPSRLGAATPAATGSQVLFCLVGEQPVPNLLPILYYRPAYVVLVHSDYTRRVAENLRRVLDATPPVTLCEVDAFAIERARLVMLDLIVEHGWPPTDLTFNFTGGTKPMSLAGYRVAQDFEGCTLIYIQTRQGRNECFEYNLVGTSFVLKNSRPQEITTVLDIDRHLRAQGLLHWNTTPEGDTSAQASFTRVIAEALEGYVDEVVFHVQDAPGSAVQIDLVVRCRNQIGLIAVAPDAADQGIDGIRRLNAFGAHEHLGIYVKRLLVLDQESALNAVEQAEIRNITLLVLPSFAASGGITLSEEDKRRLRTQVMQAFGRW